MFNSRLLRTLVLAGTIACAAHVHAAVTITIVNLDPPGVGFNDPTPAAPVGGNSGTTLGQQRLIAFSYAANIWGATLTSVVPITINASWDALTCTATSAVLGSAGATQVFRDFTGATKPGTWYSFALANKLAGADLDNTSAQIRARFNVNLGQTGCLTGTFFYLGLDRNHGANVDFVTVLLHEMGHGLGFQTFTNGSTGQTLGNLGFPSIWDFFLLDTVSGKTWDQMTDAERQASAIAPDKLAWTGTNVTAAVPSVLGGAPQVVINTPASVAGTYLAGPASFGPTLTVAGVAGEVMPVPDTAPDLGLACSPLSVLNAAAVSGKIALVDRGVCGFTVKAANVQAAGAIGMIVVDNVAGSPPPGLGGSDPTITIPAVRITLADGNALKVALRTRSRLHTGMTANMGLAASPIGGATASNQPYLYTPNPFQSGSSVSHWTTTVFPNQLMEPAINGDLTHNVTPPSDLTFPLLRDTGW